MTAPLVVIPVEGLPEVRLGDDLAELILAATELRDGDVVVVAQKVVSKSEGALVDLVEGEAADAARRRVALEEAAEVVAESPGVLIVRTRHGFVCANAGVDASNVEEGTLSLLPTDPDTSAAALRAGLCERGADVAVIVADTFGRPWRVGQTDVAIGVAGLQPLRNEAGNLDRNGIPLKVTEPAVADALAAAADLTRGKADGVPVVVIRGFDYQHAEHASARDLVRGRGEDLFARGRGMLAAALLEPWPLEWEGGVAGEELALVRHVAPDLVVLDAGPPSRLTTADAFAAGLAAGVLADAGLAVRWLRDGPGVILEAGHPPARR